MLSTNVRVGEACDFTTICDTAKVCEGGAGLHPQGSAEGGAKVAVREGNSQGSQPKDRASSVSPRYWKVRRRRSYELDDCAVGVCHSARPLTRSP
jgi:hypothetical protein